MARDAAPTVTVDNTREVPVVVYLERGRFDTRLGMVDARTKATLQLPRYLEDGQAVTIFVHPEGGQDLSANDLTVKNGGNLDIYVPANDAGYVPPPAPEVIANPGEGSTTITVQNERDRPVVVFLERGEFDTRIGTAPANEEVTLQVPRSLIEERPDVEIFVHPEGGEDLASQFFQLSPGAHLVVKVPAR